MIRQVPVPGTQLEVSRLVLGSVMFLESKREASFALLDRYWELGGNTIDLAHIYNGGQSHRVVGEWVRDRGLLDQVILFDKGCHPYGKPRFSPDFVRGDLEENLERLGMSRVTSFTFHRDEPSVELTPIVQELGKLREEGKVSYWGGSNWTVSRIQEFNRVAEGLGVPGMSWNNPHLGLAEVNEPMWPDCHTATDEELAWHESIGFPLFSWSSTSGGYFAGVDTDDTRRVYDNPTSRARRDRATSLGKELGLSAHQVALAWVLNHPFPTFALIGPANPEQLEQSMEASQVALTSSQLRWLRHGVE